METNPDKARDTKQRVIKTPGKDLYCNNDKLSVHYSTCYTAIY